MDFSQFGESTEEIRELAGDERAHYVQQLLTALELAELRSPMMDFGYVGSLLRTADFGSDIKLSLQKMPVGQLTGLPSSYLFGMLSAQSRIESRDEDFDDTENKELTEQAIADIKRNLLRNQFSLEDDELRKLKRMLFTTRMRDLDYKEVHKISIRESDPEEDFDTDVSKKERGLHYIVTLNGHEITHNAWLRYDLDLRMPYSSMGRNPFVSEAGILIRKAKKIITGNSSRFKPKRKLEHILTSKFGLYPEEIFSAINKTHKARVGYVKRCGINGFYPYGSRVGDQDPGLMALLFDNPGTWMLDWEERSIEDENILFYEKFTREDINLTDASLAEDIDERRERKRYLVVPKSIAEDVRRYAKHLDYNCEVIS